MRASHILLVALAFEAALPSTPRSAEPAPYRLSVAVDWGRRSGPESLRETLAGELVAELQRRRCFRSVRVAPAEPADDDLLLRVVVDGYDEVVEHEYRIADRGDVTQNTDGQSRATIEAWFDAEVQSPGEGLTIRRHRFRQRGSWKPLMNEDPRPEALRSLLENAVRSLRKFACKGSPTKWAEQLERARSKKPH